MLSLETNLSAEVANRIADVEAEESRAIAAEGSLATAFASADSAEASIRLAADQSLTAALSSEVEARIGDVNAEESRAIEAEGSLAANFIYRNF